MKHDHRSGFTLIEIIIVIIILGILAAVALPQITKNLETAKAAEAINMLGAAAKSVSDCYTITEDMQTCDNWNSVNPDMG
ncbi:MAG TPA: prepilin-type N-terminal cleavage/methylation domain-containing protein, partial [Candidatus Omnitrophota bacterium]|nr:prepilin-type N-terminal cleavage/methylation domain-containing protein [Candidatus Omnitrophota bacterium]